MAKRKTPKAEKVVDLAPKPEKINEQQLAKLQATIKTVDQLTTDIGRMEIQKQGLLKQLENLHNNIQTMRVAFIKDYGTDNIDIESGIITYPPQETDNGEINQED